MVKGAVKKVKMGQINELKTAKATVEDMDVSVSETSPKKVEKHSKNGPHKTLKQSLVEENTYISDLMKIIHFPKRDDDDDDDGVVLDKSKKMSLAKKGGAQNVQELRQRLQAKLESLKGPKGEGKKKKKKLSKEEKKAKLKEEKKLEAKLAKMNSAKAASSVSNGLPKAKPVYNSDGKMVFSKFDFTSSNGHVDSNPAKKKKDPKSTLQSIQKQKEKIKKLAEKGETEVVKNIEESSAWSKALDKTEGVKVKDDVGLLKKSIKKQEQKKKSSAKKWEVRKEDEQKKKDARQTKRTENIQKRKSDNKATKMKKLSKKGRIPGFR